MSLTKIITYTTYFLVGSYVTRSLYSVFKSKNNKGRDFKYNTNIDIEAVNNKYGGSKEDNIDKSKYTFMFTIDNDSVHHIKNFVNFILLNIKESEKILIKINSSGGASYLFFSALTQLKRLKNKYEVIIFVEGVACSGGYLVASIGDKIYTTDHAILGSIGVYTESYKINDLLQTIGIDSKMIYAGKNKVVGSMIGKRTEEEDDEIKKEIDKTHEKFKKVISENRKKIKDIDVLATGDTFDGLESVENGLADEIMSIEDYLINEAKEKFIINMKHSKNNESSFYKTLFGLFIKKINLLNPLVL